MILRIIIFLGLHMSNALFLLLFLISSSASAATILKVTIKDHKLVPNEITAPAGEAFFIEVTNEGPGTEEFESDSLRLEKIILQGQTTKLRVGPQKPGRYEMFGEFHLDTCTGVVIVK